MSRSDAFRTYLWQDLLRHNLFKPASYLTRQPALPTFQLLLLRCQSSCLPSHIAHPTRGWLPFPRRSCPHCPALPGLAGPCADELHAAFGCPHSAQLQSCSTLLQQALRTLHFEQNLDWSSLPQTRQLSLMLGTMPPYPLSAADRDAWLRTVTPLAASFALALDECYANP